MSPAEVAHATSVPQPRFEPDFAADILGGIPSQQSSRPGKLDTPARPPLATTSTAGSSNGTGRTTAATASSSPPSGGGAKPFQCSPSNRAGSRRAARA